ncbi:MAG: phosphonoacetaldehyde reductase [Ignavibacteria bacterium]
MTVEEFFGIGSIVNVSDLISKYKINKIFLVTGKNSYHLSGAEANLSKILKDSEIIHYNNCSENPKIEDIEKGIELFKGSGSEMVIAVGGGSVIDVAKLINFISFQNDYDITSGSSSNIFNIGKPLIAIPTTSGSGSEATHFAVVYKDKEKYSVAHEYILPDISIVDPQLTLSLSPGNTAASGVDALSQAIESYWCVNSNVTSKGFAEESIKLILSNLENAVNNPNIENRTAMSNAANLAGKAINITKTTAPHAVSYSMTSFFGITHGQAVSLTLGEFLKYNYEVSESDKIDKRGVEYVKCTIEELAKIIGCENVYDAKEKISELMKAIGLKTKLSEFSINSEKDIKLILDNVNLQRLSNNPRSVSKAELKKILSNIL